MLQNSFRGVIVNRFKLVKDVWEVLQSKFETVHSLKSPVNGGSLQESSEIRNIQHHPNGNGKNENYFAHQGNGKDTKLHFITNGGGQGNGHNAGNLANGNKTVMDFNGRRIYLNVLLAKIFVIIFMLHSFILKAQNAFKYKI